MKIILIVLSTLFFCFTSFAKTNPADNLDYQECSKNKSENWHNCIGSKSYYHKIVVSYSGKQDVLFNGVWENNLPKVGCSSFYFDYVYVYGPKKKTHLYCGKFKNGLPNDLNGEMLFDIDIFAEKNPYILQFQKYNGSFINGKLTGKGIISGRNLGGAYIKFEGYFKNGTPNGEGVLNIKNARNEIFNFNNEKENFINGIGEINKLKIGFKNFLLYLEPDYYIPYDKNTPSNIRLKSPRELCKNLDIIEHYNEVLRSDIDCRKLLNSDIKKKIIPKNAFKDGREWKCKNGFYRYGVVCLKIPENAYAYGLSWKCNDSFNMIGSICKIKDISSSSKKVSSGSSLNNSELASFSNKKLCMYASKNGKWETRTLYKDHVQEAKRRGLSCGVGSSTQTASSDSSSNKNNTLVENKSNFTSNLSSKENLQKVSYNFKLLDDNKINKVKNKIMENNYFPVNESKYWINLFSNKAEIREIKGYSNRLSSRIDGNVRVLDGVKINSKIVGYGILLTDNSNLPICYIRSEYPKLTFIGKCENGINFNGKYKPYGTGKGGNFIDGNNSYILGPSLSYARNENFSKEFFRKLELKLNSTYVASKVSSSNDTNTLALQKANQKALQAETETALAKSETEIERKKRIELEQQLAELKSQQQKKQKQISQDNQIPLIDILSSISSGKQGIVNGRATDNVEIAEVTIDGKTIPIDNNGYFEHTTYIREGGTTLTIEAFDMAGLSSMVNVSLERNDEIVSNAITFDPLNPLGKTVSQNNDALALIIGVSDYEKTKDAIYADSDAKMFSDYATDILGIPSNRIKTLVNDGADEIGVLLGVKNWLRRSTKQNQSDVYLFFAGHGLASDNGEDMYLLPYDGSPELLEETAILKEKLFKEVETSNPRSVIAFLDTCYSGTTRDDQDITNGTRDIVIVAKEQPVPQNFTVFTAASGTQKANPLEEAKHGLFSYFLMKGMEGEADSNNDNAITAGELHSYVQKNVIQQSDGSQTPELQGDVNRVLVRFQ